MTQRLPFPVLFLLIFLLLQVAYLALPVWAAQVWLIDILTVRPSAAIMSQIWPHNAIVAEGSSVVSNLGRINVLRGCEGTETMLLLIAALLASRRPVKTVIIGTAAGCALIYGLNQLRIIVLYWSMINQPDWFGVLHGYIAPLLIVLLAMAFFVLWYRYAERVQATASRP